MNSMTFANENEFQLWLMSFRHAHWTHLDAKMHGTGFPDLSYCYDSMEGLIELKVRPGLRPTQKSWFRQRVEAEGRPMLWFYHEQVIYIHTGVNVVNRLSNTNALKTWCSSAKEFLIHEGRSFDDIQTDVYYYLRYPPKGR